MAAILTINGGVYQWNPKELSARKKLASGDGHELISAAVAPDGNELAISDGNITIFSIANDTQRKPKDVKNASHLIYAHDSKTLYFSTSTSKGFVVQSHNLAENRTENTLLSHDSEITSLSISNNSTYILSTSTTPPKVLLQNTMQSTVSSLSIKHPLNFTLFHPTRMVFLCISKTGDLTSCHVTSKSQSRTFPIRATTATWWNKCAIAACEDMSVKIVDFVTNTIVSEFRIGAPATSIACDDNRIFLGLKTGRCEMWSISKDHRCKKVSEVVAGRGGSPILGIQWTSNIAKPKTRTQSAENTSQKTSRESMFMKDDITTNVLDVFSPIKRKENDTENPVETKQKRPRDSTLVIGKGSPKRFSTVVDPDGKKMKPDQSTKREDIRSKELQMDLEIAKALTSKVKSLPRGFPNSASPLGISTKDNLPSEKPQAKSPRKSILKSTVRESPTQLHAQSPLRQQTSHQDRVDIISMGAVPVPEFEKESPIVTIRRKSPERTKTRSDPNLARSVNQPSPKKQVIDDDLWATIAEPPPSINNGISPIRKKEARSPTKRGVEAEDKEPRDKLPPELGTAALEIQTVLRRDIERLRLDMVRQFVSFKSEMGQKWEGEVERLRRENEKLKEDISVLKKNAEKRNDGVAGWKLY